MFKSGLVLLVMVLLVMVVFSRVELLIVPLTGNGSVVFVSGCVSFPSAFTCMAVGERASRIIRVYVMIFRFISTSLATHSAWLY